MRDGSWGTFIGEVPEMRIEGGLFHLISGGRDYYMRPSTVRRYVETARRLLDQFEREQGTVVPMARVAG